MTKKRLTPDQPNFNAGAPRDELARAIRGYIESPNRSAADTRYDVKTYMRDWVNARPDRGADLTVWCIAPYRGKPCNSLVGQVWTTPATFTNRLGQELHGHYYRARMRPFIEGTEAEGNVATSVADAGLPTYAANIALHVALSEEDVVDGCLELMLGRKEDPTLPAVDGVLFGCGRHEQTMVAISALILESDSTRRKLNLSGGERLVGYTHS